MSHDDHLVLPSLKRRAAAAKAYAPELKPNKIREISKKFSLPQHLVRHFVKKQIITDRGDTTLDVMILWAIVSLERDRRFCRYMLSKFSKPEITDLICQAGLDNLDVLIYNMVRNNPRISKGSILATLLQVHGIPANDLILEKIPVLRRRISNQRYRLRKIIENGLGSEEDFEETKAVMESLRAEGRARSQAKRVLPTCNTQARVDEVQE